MALLMSSLSLREPPEVLQEAYQGPPGAPMLGGLEEKHVGGLTKICTNVGY